MTYLMVVSYGLIAGLKLEEIHRMTPGAVLDLYLYRRQYDDVMHWITRGE